MPDGDDIFIRLRDLLIEEGIESVKESMKGEKLEGAILGFQICRHLNTIKAFEARLVTRGKTEHEMRCNKKEEKGYWRYRYASLQIEYCFEVLKVYVGGYESYSARSAMRCCEMLRKLGLIEEL